MFNMGSQPTITKLVLKSADSVLESANSSTDSNADPKKKSVYWYWPLPMLTISKIIDHYIPWFLHD